MRCLLIGNYGTGNLGDEALKEYFLTRFPEVEWTVLSASPSASNEVPRLPLGPRSLFTPWWRTVRALRASDAVVFGGGSLFTDVESVFACFLWWWHAFVARLCGKPVLLAFQGVGPFRSRVGERLARGVISRAAFVSVRDSVSAERVRGWVDDRMNAVESFDPVFSVFDHQAGASSGNILGVIPRANSGQDFAGRVMEHVKHHDRSQTIRIVSMHPDSRDEQRVCLALVAAINAGAQILPVRSLGELAEALRGCAHVITARYHGGLAALAMSIPFDAVAQHPGDKLETLSSAPGADALREKLSHGERELLKSLNMVK